LESAEGAQLDPPFSAFQTLTRKHHFAPSALNQLAWQVPGALPQAITFRAFGATKSTCVLLHFQIEFSDQK